MPLLTEAGVDTLASKTLAVAGCGGVGGAHSLLMARMGVGRFRLADPGIFDEPDINRQWGASVQTLQRKKVDVYRDMLIDVNPDIDVHLFSDGITEDNHGEFLEGADVLMDCLDVSVPLELREALHEEARKRKIYIITAPVIGFGCVLACSLPDRMSMKFFTKLLRDTHTNSGFAPALAEIFMPEHLELIGNSINSGRVPSVAVSPALAASLAATETIVYMLQGIIPGGREPFALPKMLFFDLFRMSYVYVDGLTLFQIDESEL